MRGLVQSGHADQVAPVAARINGYGNPHAAARQDAIRQALSRLVAVPFAADFSGSTIIYDKGSEWRTEAP